jgi:hypothetical protein
MSSVEPSSQTTISRAGSVCAKTDDTARPIVCEACHAAITTENLGRGPGPAGLATAGTKKVGSDAGITHLTDERRQQNRAKSRTAGRLGCTPWLSAVGSPARPPRHRDTPS